MTNIESLILSMRAKVGVIWVVSAEELRVERAVADACAQFGDAAGYELHVWSASRGLRPVTQRDPGPEDTRDAIRAFQRAVELPGRACCLFHDLGPWLKDPLTLRCARDLQRLLPTLPKESSKQVVVVDLEPPPRAMVGAAVIEWALPDREAVASIVRSCLEWAPDAAAEDVKKNSNEDQIIDAAIGLPAEDIATSIARSLAATGRIDPTIVSAEKERIVRGSGLEWRPPDPRGMDGIGGLAALKEWLAVRRQAFSEAAREYGLPSPKGILLLGVPGCGKSLTAKCVATAWGLPLLRMNVGALFSKWVGESEQRFRTALQTAEAVAPCVLWLDEVEKAFGGDQGGDAGTSQRVFGEFLTWMEERRAGVFVIATANSISKLPPEFLRAGRWDDTWWIDLPTEAERAEIAEVLVRKYRNCGSVDPRLTAGCSTDRTGAEMEAAFQEAMFTAFSAGRPVETKDVVGVMANKVPLVRTMAEELTKLREWARGRARSASGPAPAVGDRGKREVE